MGTESLGGESALNKFVPAQVWLLQLLLLLVSISAAILEGE